MSVVVQRFISDIQPGDVVDVNRFEDEHGCLLKRVLLDELEGRGFVLDSRGVLGEVAICSKCDGEGQLKGKCCAQCDGESTTIDQGRGKKPFRQ